VRRERLDERRACRIRVTIPGGYRSPVEAWDTIQQQQVAAMNQLEQALKPQLKILRLKDE